MKIMKAPATFPVPFAGDELPVDTLDRFICAAGQAFGDLAAAKTDATANSPLPRSSGRDS